LQIDEDFITTAESSPSEQDNDAVGASLPSSADKGPSGFFAADDDTTRNKLIAGLITTGELGLKWPAVSPSRVASRYRQRVALKVPGVAHLSRAKRARKRRGYVGPRGA
jgi:hypothetical protein